MMGNCAWTGVLLDHFGLMRWPPAEVAELQQQRELRSICDLRLAAFVRVIPELSLLQGQPCKV